MRNISPQALAKLKAGKLLPRDFVRFVVRNRDTGAPVQDCYWSDIYAINAAVTDPDTGLTAFYDFAPGGGLINISDIVLVSDLTVQTVRIKLSQVSDRVNQLVRGYDCKQGRVQIWRGLFDPATMTMDSAGLARFTGTIDDAPITTPKENDPSGDVTLTCTGNTQELTRTNPEVACHDSQQERLATDDSLIDVAVVGNWPVHWGGKDGPVRTAPTLDAAKAVLGLFGGPR